MENTSYNGRAIALFKYYIHRYCLGLRVQSVAPGPPRWKTDKPIFLIIDNSR
jgi:hypothetical protein